MLKPFFMKNPFILLLILLVPFITFSQKDSTKTKDLTEVVISGVRADSKDPVSQSNFNKSDIQKNYVGQDFNALMVNKAPSLTFRSDAGNSVGYQYMKMRGIDQTRINFSLNGISLADPEDFGFYASNFTDFMSNINSIQIQRGVGITPSGIGNLVGSVNFESPNLSDSAYNDIQTGYGSFNTSRLSAGFNTGITKSGFAAYGRFSNTYSDGYRKNSGTNANTFFTSIGYYGKKNTFKLTAFSGASKNQMSYLPTSLKDIDSLGPRTNYLSPDEKDDFRQNFIQLQHTRKTGECSFLTSNVYYIGLQGSYGVKISPTMYNYSLFSDLYGAMSTWAFIKEKFSFRLGINGNSYYRNHSMSIAPDLNQNIYSNRGNKTELSVFTKVSYRIYKLTVFADLQYRTATFSYRPSSGYDFTVKPITWIFFNPKGGLTYDLNNKSSLFASVGQMHREPTRNDMFAGFDDMDTSNVALIGNLARVKPEQVIDYEEGYRFSGKRLNFSINAFYMDFKNQIVLTGPYSSIGLPLTKNLDSKSWRYGLELEYNYHLCKHLSLAGTATYMKANISRYHSDFDASTYRNITPLLTPQWIANQSVCYSFLKNKIDITLSARYVSVQYLGNDNNKNLVVPEALTFNSAISIRPTKRISLSLMCNNITNKRLLNGGYSVLGSPYYFVGAPRNYYVALNYRF